MNRWISLVGWLVLLMPVALPAQHHGQAGGVSSGGRSSTGKSDSDDLRDFKRAVALQASPDQAALFHEVAKSTEAARKSAQDFLQLAHAGTADSSRLHDLSDAVAEAQSQNQKFLLTFGAAQKSLLKDLTKKMGKADTEITKQNKLLGQTGNDGKQSAEAVEKIDKALGELLDRQATLKSEMGIKDESPAQ